MKYITVKLTEDQARWLLSATQSEIDYWQEAKETADASGWNKHNEAFGIRVKAKLLKGLA